MIVGERVEGMRSERGIRIKSVINPDFSFVEESLSTKTPRHNTATGIRTPTASSTAWHFNALLKSIQPVSIYVLLSICPGYPQDLFVFRSYI
jgi:hypothetical protein